ncbi:glycosyltransferase family 4 protein [Candidatus Contubernalis alkaliaceticus]|uniref:glycosyltransferase family 4 protein n=1 Tax=Candidatus Contubernalis alkaliaceticus TaxID=338645 RepID=UPI001F4BEC43|nr:glycosyltransferase family 4 protein [Candidatus Contubernalis alkalaceticus]UNC92387.1 glycosyltransferase family 4 protein [Candidatus Contubernalis alkalaceticus]
MKIGIFTDSFRPYKSGVVRSIESFSSQLTLMGHEVYVFGPDYPNCEKEDRVFRFISIPAPTQPDFTLAIPFSPKLGKTIKELGIDIIHLQSPFLLGRLGLRYAKKYNIPLVFTYHTMYDQYVHYLPIAKNFSKVLMQRWSKDFCNHCDLVITPTEIVQEHIKSSGVEVPVINLSTGIDTKEFEDTDSTWLRKNFGFKDDETILLHIGRLGKEKNVSFLLKAFKEILNHQPKGKLVIVGGGPDLKNLQNTAEDLNIHENVIFTGIIPREQLINAYAGADIFIFASLTETQGLVLCEAKAAGLPVVAVKALGASEMINNGLDGYLTSYSQGQFVEKVLVLMENRELREDMSQRAKESAFEMSSYNQTKKLLNAYKGLLEWKNKYAYINAK